MESADIRASYYKTLYDQSIAGVSQHAKGKLLDIAGGDLMNTLTFGKDFNEAWSMDVKFSKDSILRAKKNNLHLILADAHNLPFKSDIFYSATMISVIEHIQHPGLALQEAARVLRPGGELVVQIPNRFFPIEPHTGLIFIYYIPSKFRKALLRGLRYSYYLSYVPSFPTRKEVHHWLRDSANLKVMREVILPAELIPPKVRPLYKLFVRIGLLKLLPQSWLSIYIKS